jgi:cytochrome b pre-mRNA-processing protein 6
MRRRTDQRFLPASSSNTLSAAQAVANSAIDERIELEQVNAIYSLLENRYSRKVGTLLDLANDKTDSSVHSIQLLALC